MPNTVDIKFLISNIYLILLSLTHEIFLKASFSNGFWFTFMEHRITLFDRSDKIIDILADEHF